MSAANGNVWRLQALSTAWGFLLLQGIMVPFFQMRGLSLHDVFTVQSAFALTMGLLDVPTGYLADRIGRRSVLIGAGLFKGIGGTVLALGHGLPQMMIAYIALAIGNSLLSGTNLAMLYDSIEDREDNEKQRILATLHVAAFGGLTAAVLLGGVLAHFSLDIAAWVNCATAWTCLPLAYSLREVAHHRSVRQPRKTLKQVFHLWRDIYSPRSGALPAALMVPLYGSAATLAANMFQSRLSESGSNLVSMGGFAAGVALVGAIGGRYVPSLKNYFGTSAVALLVWLGPIVGFAAGYLPYIGAITAGWMTMEVLRSLVNVSLIGDINKVTSSADRATVNSILSFMTRCLVALVAPLIGLVGQNTSMATAMGILSGVFGIIGLVNALWWWRSADAAKEAGNV